MANALATYVEKFILNPAVPVTIDEDGLSEHTAVVSERVSGSEGVGSALTSASKLRIRNAKLLAERDPRYKGKKISREALKSKTEVSYDPELAKYYLVEAEDDVVGSKDDSGDSDSDSEEENYKDSPESGSKKRVTFEDDLMKLGEDVDEDDDDDDSESNLDDTIDKTDSSEDEKEEDEEDHQSIDKESDIDDDLKESQTVMTFSQGESEAHLKGEAIKNQYAIYDLLFEARIGMQKLVTASNQLPQHDTYRHFLNVNDPHFRANLQRARRAMKKLIEDLLDLQVALTEKNSDTKNLFTGNDSDNDCDSRTSSEDEGEKKHISVTEKQNKKRKVEHFGDTLGKRRKVMIPYRDDVLNKWHSKTNLLINRSSGSKFSNFEISAVQQMQNILANKGQLIQRTQLRSVTRGNVYNILGKPEEKLDETVLEVYDPEIFDDTDFYTRMLEDVLKSKVALSEDMTDVSRKFIEIQNLRRKAKKKVDTKASKGRKVRYEVMSKLQQFLGPCKPSLMDDGATNMLFASLFGKSLTAVDIKR